MDTWAKVRLLFSFFSFLFLTMSTNLNLKLVHLNHLSFMLLTDPLTAHNTPRSLQ